MSSKYSSVSVASCSQHCLWGRPKVSLTAILSSFWRASSSHFISLCLLLTFPGPIRLQLIITIQNAVIVALKCLTQTNRQISGHRAASLYYSYSKLWDYSLRAQYRIRIPSFITDIVIQCQLMNDGILAILLQIAFDCFPDTGFSQFCYKDPSYGCSTNSISDRDIADPETECCVVRGRLSYTRPGRDPCEICPGNMNLKLALY